MKNKILLVLSKELREVFRDKKSLAMMLVIPFMIPLLVIGVSAMFDAQVNAPDNKYNKVGFAYQLTEVEKEIANTMKLDYKIGTEEKIKKLYSEDKIDVYITKTNDDSYVVNYDENNQESSSTVYLVEKYLEQYKTFLQNNYLITNNIDSNKVFNIINIDYNVIGEKEDNYYVNYIVTYTFLFILIAIVTSATYPATDATAGEKERGTLETLLTFPIKSKDIILGKFLSVSISSIITGVLSLILSLVSLYIAGDMFELYKDINIMPSTETILIMTLIIITYSILVSGLSIAIAAQSKSFKEAQSALTPLTFISFFPGMISFFVNIKTTCLISIIPFLNYVQVFSDVNSGNINYLHIFLMFISTILFILIVMIYIIKAYKSEKVLFGR